MPSQNTTMYSSVIGAQNLTATAAEEAREESLLPNAVPLYEKVRNNSLSFVPVEVDAEVFVKAEVQSPGFRDVPFAIAFLLHLAGVLATGIVFGSRAMERFRQEQQDGGGTQGLATIFVMLSLTFLCAILAAVGSLLLMTIYPEKVISASFYMAPVVFFAASCVIWAFAGPSQGFYLMIAATVLSLVVFWRKNKFEKFIPFATSTLKTAITAIWANWCIMFVAVGYTAVMFTWLVFFVCYVIAGAYYFAFQREVPCADSDGMCPDTPNVVALVALACSLYWTLHVLSNMLHVTTAGTVGAWWFQPGLNASCSAREVVGALYRASTYSFGSVCFGSLVILIFGALEAMANEYRNRRDHTALLYCILQCILSCVRELVECFTSYAFVYTAMYNYGFLDSGRQVVALFKHQGWKAFITDTLVLRVLLLTKIAVAGVTACTAVVCDAVIGPVWDDNVKFSHGFSLFIGLLVGRAVSGMFLFVVESAIRTVIVCFADSPREFSENHPFLFAQLQMGWSESYPEEWSQQKAIPVDSNLNSLTA